ncbi:lantibiotic dehydratase C-terminal domain-containing protein, partial [Streptomonospora algeriensis]
MQQQSASTDAAGEQGARRADWCAWHLHLGTSARSAHDRVLSEVVGPAVDSVPGRPWFFIRYWQAGPHVRLRIGDLDAQERRDLGALLADRLAEAGRLAEGEEPLSPEGYAADAQRMTVGETGGNRYVEEMRAPGVHPADYEPEVDRYGGAGLMPRAERLFQLSSELVRGLLPQSHSPARRALVALRAT